MKTDCNGSPLSVGDRVHFSDSLGRKRTGEITAFDEAAEYPGCDTFIKPMVFDEALVSSQITLASEEDGIFIPDEEAVS